MLSMLRHVGTSYSGRLCPTMSARRNSIGESRRLRMSNEAVCRAEREILQLVQSPRFRIPIQISVWMSVRLPRSVVEQRNILI